MVVWDNLIALSAITLGVVVLAGLALALLQGGLLYRRIKRTRARVEGSIAELQAGADRAQAKVERIRAERDDLERITRDLTAGIAEIRVLTAHAAVAGRILYSPFRYLGVRPRRSRRR